MKSKVVYMDTNKAYEDELEYKASMTDLFRERVKEKYKGMTSQARLIASILVFLGVSYHLSSLSATVYFQGVSNASLPVKMIVSVLTLLVYSFIALISYALAFNVVKLGLSLYNYDKGIFMYNKVKTTARLHRKVVRGTYTSMYFRSRGVVSRVNVPNFYASLYDNGAFVPVVVEVLILNCSEKTKRVYSCVGSRSDSLPQLTHELSSHYSGIPQSQDQYLNLQSRIDSSTKGIDSQAQRLIK